MKRIGLLSDTHGYLDDRIIDFLTECDEVWHAGDIGTMEILEKLERLQLFRGVYGNIDGHKIRSAIPEVQRFRCEETEVLIKHIGGYPGRYDRTMIPYLKGEKLNLVITGHSHILKVIYDKKYGFLHINPGAAGIQGFHKIRTLVRFTINRDEISNLEVIELGGRR